jgi:hypothetical protein
LIPTFFGLGPSYRPVLHKQIFQLIYYGKGGFTWSDVYDFPIWLRIFYIKAINEAVEELNKENKKQMKSPKSSAIKRPPRFSKPR